MLEIKKHFTPFPLKNQWKRFEGKGINIYQTYYVQRTIFTRLPFYSIKGKYKPIYYEVLNNHQTVLIIPLCKYNGKDEYSIIGLFNGLQSYDFIYDHSESIETLSSYLSFFMKSLKYTKLYIKNMPQSSLVYQALQTANFVDTVCTSKNVNIFVGSCYEEYYNSLSKHTRQNIRTSYNRLNKDGLDCEFQFYINQPIERRLINELIELYCNRHEKKYEVYSSKYKRFYLKYIDFSTYCQQNHQNVYAILKIDGVIAAFLSGLIDKNSKSVIIPRLSINDDFLKYSPGIVLINETAKKLAENKNIDNLDLSKGDEKYKLSMGGEVYYTMDFGIMP